METRVGGAADVAHLADLIWRFAGDDGPPAGFEQAFAEDLRVWWEAQGGSHVPFLAVLSSGRAIGMAWSHSLRACRGRAKLIDPVVTSRASTSFPSIGAQALGLP